MSDPHISIIIPTYQRCDSVRQTLQSLAQQTLPSDQYEVILSIDGSTDGTREMASKLQLPYALHVLWQVNQGRAAACNAGIRQAVGDLVILLDDDMDAAPHFVAAHQHAHRGTALCGVLGAVPIRLDHTSPPVVQYIGRKFNRHLAKLSQPDHRIAHRDLYTGNFSIRRAVLLQVGGFDEAFKVYGNEDIELGLRLVAAGVELVYSGDALAYQRYAKDLAALARDNVAKGRTAVLLARKHPEFMPSLKLSTYHQGSRKWRSLRAVLLRMSTLWPGTSRLVIQGMEHVAQRNPRRLDLCYDLVLDYFYWLGARAAWKEQQSRNETVDQRPEKVQT